MRSARGQSIRASSHPEQPGSRRPGVGSPPRANVLEGAEMAKTKVATQDRGTAESGHVDEPDKSPRVANVEQVAQPAELSNYDIVRHYFTVAADQLELADDIRAVLLSSYREVQVQVPVKLADGQDPRLLRLPRAAQRRARAVQGRRPLPPRGRPRRGARARLADDVEDRDRQRPVRRRQGRRQLPGRRAVAATSSRRSRARSSTRSTRCSARRATSPRRTSTPTPR